MVPVFTFFQDARLSHAATAAFGVIEVSAYSFSCNKSFEGEEVVVLWSLSPYTSILRLPQTVQC